MNNQVKDAMFELFGHGNEELFGLMANHCPNLFSLCYPKDYTYPLDYNTPKTFGVTAFCAAHWAVFRESKYREQDATLASFFVTTSMLIRYQMPTYFVSHELCEALLKTEAPEDLLLCEVKFPMPAMLFMLPKTFSTQYFGYEAPYFTISCAEPKKGYNTPLVMDGIRTPELFVDNDKEIVSIGMLLLEEGYPIHYDCRAAMDFQVKDLMQGHCESYHPSGALKATQEENDLMMRKLANLGLNILLAMTAGKELITPERLLRPTRKQNGRVIRRALWKPNFIGERFKISYEKHAPEGTHRSPHAHWRVGHWRNQRHGPQNTLVKRIWIQPVFVGLKEPPPGH